MLWLIFAFLTAGFESLKDIFSKKSLRNIDEYSAAWALRFFSLPFLLPLLFFVKIPELGSKFWIALIIGGSLNVITTILYMKALKSSDLSAAIPMIAFTPLFLLVTSPLIVGEFPALLGMVGVFLIVAGSYVLNLSERKNGFFGPFNALITEPGPRLMLLVAFIWSITSNIDKIGVQNSSPLFWAVATNIFIASAITPLVFFISKKSLKLKNIKTIFPIGFFGAFSILFQFMAISLTLVVYVISIKRLSLVFGVIGGYFIFREKRISQRLVGALIMVAGVFLIAFS